MARGDHVKVWRGFYFHHGIDLGDGTVVHFTGEPGRKVAACVECTSHEVFRRDGAFTFVHHPPSRCLPRKQVVSRALSRLGETNYNLVTNNCEHFATWCKTGLATSNQVRTFEAAFGGLGVYMLVRRVLEDRPVGIQFSL